MSQSTDQVQKVVKCPNCSQKYSLPPEQLQTMRNALQKIRCKKCGLLTSADELIEETGHGAEAGKTSAGSEPGREPAAGASELESGRTTVTLSSDITQMPVSPVTGGKIKEYKVLTLKDKLLGGRFEPDKLEYALNALAAQGWTVVSMASVPATLPGTHREEMVVILERDKVVG